MAHLKSALPKTEVRTHANTKGELDLAGAADQVFARTGR
jgi:hypothetical protein